MEPNSMDNNTFDVYTQERVGDGLNRYVARTFGWMFLGLLFTFAISVAFYETGAFWYVLSIPQAFIVLALVEIGVVIFLSARVHKLSVGAARALFFAYAFLNGVVFSTYFVIFDMSSLIYVFALTSLYFGITAAIGYFTKFDLSRIRNILLTGLIFLFVFWIAAMFLDLSAYEKLASVVGVAIFLGFTAYDTQKLKASYQYYSAQPEILAKASIMGALELYLDFINLFLYLLRIFGKRSN